MIPSALLCHRVAVEPYQGESATGPVYGPAVSCACRFNGARRQVVDAHGEVVLSAGELRLRPDAELRVDDRVTLEGVAYRVLSVAVAQGATRPEYLHATLGRSTP